MSPPAPEDRRRIARGAAEIGALAAVTFLPLLLGGRGRLNADTKQYLYLDPVELLDRARTLWDPAAGGGTVTHQYLGYLWPMGPYYALTDWLGVPDWVSQRIWVGGLQFLAAAGALVLFRHLMPRHPVQVVAAAVYGLSPFVLGHVTGQSGLLTPFAAFGWMVWAMVRATEEPRRWRWPAIFALIVTTAGSLNGSSLFFVLLGAVLWVPFATQRSAEGYRRSLGVLVRAGALTLACQLWWIVGYAVGGRYGLPILALTETVETTSASTSATEVLRGLGYWFFYGVDGGGPWLQGIAPPYQASGLLLAVSFAVPLACLALGTVARWPARAYLATIVAVGTAVAVGAFAVGGRSPVGAAFLWSSERSDLVFSLRNTQRAAPLVVLGLAGLAAGGLGALQRSRPRVAVVAAVALAVLVAGALPAQWRTGLIAQRFHRDTDIPQAWIDATSHLDTGSGRVLEIPGIDFASYRWGHTHDPVSVGLTERPVITRELVPTGGHAGSDLLRSLDRAFHEGRFEPQALAPVARLLGTTDVLVRNDLEYERYRTVRPAVLWPQVSDPATGLDPPVEFGPGYLNRADPVRPTIDEIELGVDPSLPLPPQVAVLPVPDSGRPVLSSRPDEGAVIVDGDGDGVVSAAAGGLLDGTTSGESGPLLLAADLLREDEPLLDAADDDARYVLTDSNRKRAQRWYSLRENVGATEPAEHRLVPRDVSDYRLPAVPDAPAGTQTVVEWDGAERVWTDRYGSSVILLPEERPSNAFDGDPRTWWRGEFNEGVERRVIGIDVGRPVDADHLTFVAPDRRLGTIWATRFTVVLDGSRRIEVDTSLDAARNPEGLRVDLDGEPFEQVEVEITEAEPAAGLVGFAEIRIPGVQLDEVVVLPDALVRSLGDRVAEVPLAVVLERLRANPADPARADDEPFLERRLSLPAAVPVELTGTARLAAGADGRLLDELLGAGPGRWQVTATSSQHLPGSIRSRPSALVDGDPSTAWTSRFIHLVGEWVEIESEEPVALDQLELDVVVDEHHSAPTRVLLETDDGPPVELDVPPLAAGPLGTTRTAVLPLPSPVEAARVRITVLEVDERVTPEVYDPSNLVALPVAISELRLPGLRPRPEVAPVDTGCRDDLLAVDGAPVPLRVTGAAEDAEAGDGLDLEACEPLVLGSGRVELVAAPGVETGIDLDRLVFRSSAWEDEPAESAGAPEVEVLDHDRTSATGRIASDGSPFWLVLDQSENVGWELEVDGATVEGPRPVDAYAAGWLVTPDAPGTLVAEVRWAPQRTVSLALWASAAAVVVCLVLALWPRRRERPTTVRSAPVLVGFHGTAPSWMLILLATAFVALFVHLLAAPVALAILAASRRWPKLGPVVPLAAAGVAFAGVVVEQLVQRYAVGFFWPHEVGRWHHVAFLGVVLFAVSVLAGAADPGDEAARRTGPSAPDRGPAP